MIYKVLSQAGYSCLVYGKYNISYNSTSFKSYIPGTLGIFCFNNLDHARKFIRTHILIIKPHPKIFEVATDGFIRTPTFISKFYTPDYLENFYNCLVGDWDSRSGQEYLRFKDLYTGCIYPGTICVESIKLIREVE